MARVAVAPSLVLALAVSFDALLVGMVYGLRGIRVPGPALCIISLASALLFGVAAAIGQVVAGWIGAEAAVRLGALVLVAVGLWVLWQTWSSRSQVQPPAPPVGPEPARPCRVWELRLGGLGLVVQILRQPALADVDRSGSISPWEAVALGLALALDSMAAGFGAALTGFSPLLMAAAVGLGGYICLYVGSRGARLLPWRLAGGWALVHGVVLVVLGLVRFF